MTSTFIWTTRSRRGAARRRDGSWSFSMAARWRGGAGSRCPHSVDTRLTTPVTARRKHVRVPPAFLLPDDEDAHLIGPWANRGRVDAWRVAREESGYPQLLPTSCPASRGEGRKALLLRTCSATVRSQARRRPKSSQTGGAAVTREVFGRLLIGMIAVAAIACPAVAEAQNPVATASVSGAAAPWSWGGAIDRFAVATAPVRNNRVPIRGR